MSARSNRRPRVVALALGSVLALGVLTGCSGQRDPSSYTEGVQDQFVSGCTDQGSQDKDAGLEASGNFWTKSECQCAIDKIVKDVPFGTFKDINNTQINKPAPLPDSFTKVFASCNK